MELLHAFQTNVSKPAMPEVCRIYLIRLMPLDIHNTYVYNPFCPMFSLVHTATRMVAMQVSSSSAPLLTSPSPRLPHHRRLATLPCKVRSPSTVVGNSSLHCAYPVDVGGVGIEGNMP